MFLLDTHTFIWWNLAPDKLSQQVFELLKSRENTLLFSVASAWEKRDLNLRYLEPKALALDALPKLKLWTSLNQLIDFKSFLIFEPTSD